jgi:hypothetical protein
LTARSARSLASEAAFRTRLDELGATLLEAEWLGSHLSHRVRCAEGHDCAPTPHNVRQGHGICRTCAGRDPSVAARAFQSRMAEMGATVLGEYVNAYTPVTALCAAGHPCSVRPHAVQGGRGICRVCAKQDPMTAWAEFREFVAQRGGRVLEPEWLGALTPHRVICNAGHHCRPTPANARKGKGICRVCARRDPVTAETAFRARLAELGAELLEPEWLGNHRPHHVRCPNGHDCWPQPGSVRGGQGICRLCKYKNWNVFYIVTHATSARVKFGITSGDPRPRLREHRRAGYGHVEYLAANLAETMALETENAVRSALALAGARPVRGREYFDISCLPLILDVAFGWLGEAQAA